MGYVSPRYVEKSADTSNSPPFAREVVLKVRSAYEKIPPQCVAMLRFERASEGEPDPAIRVEYFHTLG